MARTTCEVPMIINPNLSEQHLRRFDSQFVSPRRDTLELVWRRTQEPGTASWSQVKSDMDRRRRMVHGLDTYKVIETGKGYALAVTAPYVWFQTVSPSLETEEYSRQLHDALRTGNWNARQGMQDRYSGAYENGGLTLRWDVKDRDEHDIVSGRSFPNGYNVLEVEMLGGEDKPSSQKDNMWGILDSGIRRRDKRGNPTVTDDLRRLEEFYPMQVELGCGPSIEAGVPALHYLHEQYHVSRPDQGGTFIFGPEQDKLLKALVGDPSSFYQRATVLYDKALTAEPTDFYRLLQELHGKGIVVGPVITNNFDGLCDRIGLREEYVRRFTDDAIVPKIDFDERARSLLVVGAHADRRKVQAQARQSGLQVIYVDPEKFVEVDRRINYPLESAQTGDFLYQMTARDFTRNWRSTYGSKNSSSR